jgi:hypothetical protein
MPTSNQPLFLIVAGASYVSPGVKNDGGGFVIVNGRIIKIPPRGPAFQKLAVAYRILDEIDGVAGAESVKTAAEKLMIAGAEELAKERELH